MLRQQFVLGCILFSACGGFVGGFLAAVQMHFSPLSQIISGICGGIGAGIGGNIAGRRAQHKHIKDD
jgi:uncharacterized membrane protein